MGNPDAAGTCVRHMHLAYAECNAVGICTDGRTYLRRAVLNFGINRTFVNARRGSMNPIEEVIRELLDDPIRHPEINRDGLNA